MIKALKAKTSMLFYLTFANNIIFSCVFFYFLIVDLYFLIPAVISQVFNPIAEQVIPIGIPSKGQKARIGNAFSNFRNIKTILNKELKCSI